MLLMMGKIHSINSEHAILTPDINKELDFYTGYYYIKNKITIEDLIIEPGLLEVYVTYTSAYIEGVNTEYYINYKLITNDGKIYTWRYYLHKEEENVYLDKTDLPGLSLTKNKIGSVIYNRKEMEERFLTREETNIEDKRYFISTPILEQRRITEIDTNIDFSGDTLFTKDEPKYFDIQKDIGYRYLFELTKDRSVYVDHNYHNNTFNDRWLDLFNLGSARPWDIELTGDVKVSEANGYFYPSHMKNFGINPLIDLAYVKMGEYFTDIHKVNDKLNPTSKNHTYRIINNTYLPGIVRDYSPTTDHPDGKHPREYQNGEISPFYIVRSMVTPDERMKTIPVVYYGHNSYSRLFSISEKKDRSYITPDSEIEFSNITNPSNKQPRQWSIGMVMTSNRNDLDLEEMFKKRNDISYSINTSYYYFKKDNISWGDYYLNESGSNISHKLDDLHLNLFDINPDRILYRSHSTNVDNDKYITLKLDILNNSDAITDIRLGPEVRTVYDRTTIPLTDSENRFIKIENDDPAMALTYFKADIVKDSPRYTLENRELAYSITYPEQQNFVQRFNSRLNLKTDEKLAIDRITVGFRPIQVKNRGVWKNIDYKERMR